MPMQLTYLVSGLLFLLCGVTLFHMSYTQSATLFRLTRANIGRVKSDESVVNICYVFAVGALAIGIALLIGAYWCA